MLILSLFVAAREAEWEEERQREKERRRREGSRHLEPEDKSNDQDRPALLEPPDGASVYDPRNLPPPAPAAAPVFDPRSISAPAFDSRAVPVQGQGIPGERHVTDEEMLERYNTEV